MIVCALAAGVTIGAVAVYLLLRPPANTDLNLNAFGDSWPVGTKVGLWTWSGGDKNEVWTSTLLPASSFVEAQRRTG